MQAISSARGNVVARGKVTKTYRLRPFRKAPLSRDDESVGMENAVDHFSVDDIRSNNRRHHRIRVLSPCSLRYGLPRMTVHKFIILVTRKESQIIILSEKARGGNPVRENQIKRDRNKWTVLIHFPTILSYRDATYSIDFGKSKGWVKINFRDTRIASRGRYIASLVTRAIDCPFLEVQRGYITRVRVSRVLGRDTRTGHLEQFARGGNISYSLEGMLGRPDFHSVRTSDTACRVGTALDVRHVNDIG